MVQVVRVNEIAGQTKAAYWYATGTSGSQLVHRRFAKMNVYTKLYFRCFDKLTTRQTPLSIKNTGGYSENIDMAELTDLFMFTFMGPKKISDKTGIQLRDVQAIWAEAKDTYEAIRMSTLERFISEGLTQVDIAELMEVSIATIERHISKLK